MHVIRLRGPWRWRLAGDASSAEPRQVRLPSAAADLQLESGSEIILERSFHAPTGLEDAAAVRLALLSGAGGVGLAELNGHPLSLPGETDQAGEASRAACVAALLRDRNLLRVRLRVSRPDLDLLQAHLEIE